MNLIGYVSPLLILGQQELQHFVYVHFPELDQQILFLVYREGDQPVSNLLIVSEGIIFVLIHQFLLWLSQAFQDVSLYISEDWDVIKELLVGLNPLWFHCYFEFSYSFIVVFNFLFEEILYDCNQVDIICFLLLIKV